MGFCRFLRSVKFVVRSLGRFLGRGVCPPLIFLITPPTTRLFAGYPYTTGTQKAAKISNKNSFFNWVHSLHTELMNASQSTNSFTNSSIRSDKGLTLETSAF